MFLTGLGAFDNILSNAPDNTLIVLSGQTQIGRSSLALTIARNRARMLPTSKILYFSSSDAAIKHAHRLISMETYLDSESVRNSNSLDSSKRELIKSRCNWISQNLSNLLFLEERDLDRMLILIMKHEPSLLIIDDIQSVITSGYYQNISTCMSKIANICVKFKISAIIITRTIYDNRTAIKYPTDEVFHYADIVLFLKEQDNINTFYKSAKTETDCFLSVVKNSFGQNENMNYSIMFKNAFFEFVD